MKVKFLKNKGNFMEKGERKMNEAVKRKATDDSRNGKSTTRPGSPRKPDP